jgi:Holliday junction resolvase RusA-like endonuclease
MKSLVFSIPKTPHAQRRVRFTKMGRTYSPNVAEEQWAIQHIIEQLPEDFEIITGPVAVFIVASFERPKSHYGTGRNAGKLKKSAPKHCMNSKDFDNIGKHICDSMNKLVYKDDRQIVDGQIVKRWTEYDADTLIEVTPLGD